MPALHGLYTRTACLAATVALLLGACSPAPPSPAGQKPDTSVQTGARQADVAESRRGGQVNIPLNGTPKLLNPILRGELSTTMVNWAIFDSLVIPDPATLENRPQMATGWQVSDDRKTWTFELKDGIKWHDGRPFGAEDVKFTYEKILETETNTGFRPNVSAIDKIEAVSPQAVRFTLKRPDSSFLSAMQIPIVPKHLLEGKDVNTDGFNQQPVGTGAFKLKEYVAASHVIVEANPDFHLGQPLLDRIVFKVIPDVNVRVAQVRTGELDVMDAVEAVHLKELEGNPNLSVYKMNQTNVYGFFVNWQKYPFDDLKVRQAINYGVDRQVIVDKVLDGLGMVAGSAFPPAFAWAWNKDIPAYPYDPTKAKELLREAGWVPGADGILQKDGKPFTFELVGDKGSPARERIATLGQQYFKDLGMDVSLKFVEWNQFLEKYQWSHDKEMTLLWNAYNPPLDPDALARRWVSSSPPRENQTHYSNPEVDALFAKATEAQDQSERQRYYFQIQEKIAADAPMVLLYYPVEVAVAKTTLKGIVPAPYRIYHNMEQWYWEK